MEARLELSRLVPLGKLFFGCDVAWDFRLEGLGIGVVCLLLLKKYLGLFLILIFDE